MVFQKAGRKAKLRPIKYRDRILEIVKSFTYLGVPFTSSGLFKEAEEYFTEKARKATGAVWNILAASKLNDWTKRTDLFNSLVSSTLLYCSGIWGFNHTHEIDKTQRNFLKILLSIPQGTPGYMIRCETGTHPLEVRVIKRALKYLVKVMHMPGDRLPRTCLDQLIRLHNSQTLNQRNWFSKIVKWLKETNHEHLLDSTPSHLEANIDSILEARKMLWIRRDIQRVRNSTYSTRYGVITPSTELCRQDYLNLSIPMDVTRLLAQLRLLGDERICFRLKSFCYSFNAGEICEACDLNQKETLDHIFSICPAYESIRMELEFRLNLTQMTVDVNKENAFKIYKFVKKCLRHRWACLGMS